MDYFKKKEIFKWGVILLTLLNTAAIVTIVYHAYLNPKKHTSRNSYNYDKRDFRKSRVHDRLDKMLNLTNKQSRQFKLLRNEQFDEINFLYHEERIASREVLKEIAKLESDTLVINQLLEKLNKVKYSIEKKRTHHFLTLKSYLDDEQKRKFIEVFKRMKRFDKYHHKRSKKRSKR